MSESDGKDTGWIAADDSNMESGSMAGKDGTSEIDCISETDCMSNADNIR